MRTGSAGTSAAAWAPGIQTGSRLRLDAEANDLREIIRTGKGQKKARALKRLKVVSAFLNTRNSPMAWFRLHPGDPADCGRCPARRWPLRHERPQ